MVCTVLDKPLPPRNLEVTSITAETAELQWAAPEDDGGSAITHYVTEKKNLQRNTWQEIGKPTDCQLHVVDLHDQNKYLFRVSAVNGVGASEPCELAEPVTAKNPFSKYKVDYFTTLFRCLSFVFAFRLRSFSLKI